MNKKFLIPLAFVGILLLGFALERPKYGVAPSPKVEEQGLSQITIGSTTIAVELADTPQKRTKGLSGRASLADGSGMLFVFEEEGSWGIWMKEMKFSIDILWADREGEILSIAHNILPESFPTSFYPDEPRALYVLEVPAGFAEAHDISEGERIVLK